jgi:hypothetical protein
MKPIIFASLLCLLATPVFAQNQFDQLHQIELQHEQSAASARAAATAKADAARARQNANDQANRRQQLAAEHSARQQASELRKVRETENTRLRSRAEQFEDEDREIALMERRIKLQKLKAEAARSNDFIDAELRERAAKTDVIQSEADASRNVTLGTKSLLEDAGTAEINRSKSFFGD